MTKPTFATTGEQAVWDFLDERRDDVLEFTRRLIATPSPNPPGDERAVAKVVAERLDEFGIDDVEWLSTDEDRANLMTRPNLIARIPGDGPGRTLILSGHLDTKPAGDMDKWETDPWDPVVREGNLVGLGSGDMKAAVAGMVYAAAALKTVGGFGGELTLVLTADEEAGSVLGSKWLAEAGHLRGDTCVIGEPSGIFREWEAVHVISRGAALFKVKITGTQMHSSISDRIHGVNATLHMARLMDRMDREMKEYLTYDEHPLCPTGPTVNVGVMAEAGVFYGVYPGNAEFACDIRTIPGMTEESVIADVQRFLDDAMADDPELDAELAWDLMVPATEISPDEPIVQELLRAAEDVLGERPTVDAFPGATDASAIQLTSGIPTVAAFGPGMLPRAHSPNEYMAADGPGLSALIYGLASLRYLTEEAS